MVAFKNIGAVERTRRRKLYEQGLKWCPRCEETLPLERFHNNASRRDGVTSACKVCTLEYRDSGRNRRWSLKSNYGLTVEQYAAIRDSQMGRCAICFEALAGGVKEHLDHDHDTGLVRGILCRGCNIALGWINDDPKKVMDMLLYLHKHGKIA